MGSDTRSTSATSDAVDPLLLGERDAGGHSQRSTAVHGSIAEDALDAAKFAART